MPALLSLIIPALLPIVGDGVRGIFNWLTGGRGAEPVNAQEAIALQQAETEKLKAIAQLDTPAGNISPWVADLRASFRYLAAAAIIIPTPFLALYGAFNPTVDVVSFIELYINSLAGPVFSFLFGQRLAVYFRKR